MSQLFVTRFTVAHTCFVYAHESFAGVHFATAIWEIEFVRDAHIQILQRYPFSNVLENKGLRGAATLAAS